MLHSLLSRLVTAIAIASFAFSIDGSATAHSRQETTVPANGEVVAAAPEVISISFDKPVRITLIELTDADGKKLALERKDEMTPVTLFEATPAPLTDGRFTVEWRGLSADGHPMNGRFSFEVKP